MKLDQSLTIDQYSKRVSTLTPGMSGADLANLCNEAAISAARNNRDHVGINDFEMASERVIAGIQKSRLVDKKERELVAIHESGHAVVSWFSEYASPLLKLTIIPRAKGSLGFA